MTSFSIAQVQIYRLLVSMLFGLLLFTTAVSAADDKPSSRIVEGAGGVPLVVQEWGNRDGIPVLLLHGFSFGAVAFSNQVGEISQELHLIAPDLRGHGLSGKPWTPESYAGSGVWAEDIRRIIEAFALDRPVIIGWSFGGYVAMNYLRHCDAEHATQCASGLLLVGSLAGIVPRPPPPDPTEIGLPPMKGDSRVDDYRQFFDNAEWMARVMSFEPPSDGDLLEKQLTIVMMPPYVRRAMTGLALDNRDLSASLDLPVLFIHGEKDSSVPPAFVADAVAALPNASAISVSGAGHSPFAEAPETFNRLLLDFAQSVYRH
jgi:pimeloyl-ACP methyl ester carboxylesterase